MTSIGGTRRNTVAGGEGSLRDHLGSMFTGHVLPRCPTITFPQSSIIYADSLQQAHRILKDQGYFVVSSEEVELFKASANQEINFKSATKGLTPAFSELRFKREEGKKTFFAKDYKKLRIKIGERGETTDWILMKQANQCCDKTSKRSEFVANNKALSGTMVTSSLPCGNNNNDERSSTEGWRKERKKSRKALRNSPAYIRSSLQAPSKKKQNRREGYEEERKEVNREETTKNTKAEKVSTGKVSGKCSRYFTFVKRILEQKKEKKRAAQQERRERCAEAKKQSTDLIDLTIVDVKPEGIREVKTKSAKQVFLEENAAKKLLLEKKKKVELRHQLLQQTRTLLASKQAVPDLYLSEQPLRLRGGGSGDDSFSSNPKRSGAQTDEEQSQEEDLAHEDTDVCEKIVLDDSSEEEGVDISVDTSNDYLVPGRKGETSLFTGQIELSTQFSMEVENDMEGERAQKGTDHEMEDANDSRTFEFKFLEKLDRHFLESPRIIVRGIWRGETLELVARRKTHGTSVEWTLMERRFKKMIMLVKGRMMYKAQLGPSSKYNSMSRKYGYQVTGGVAWSGYGYGFVNVFPSSNKDKSIKHIDLEEAVLPNGNQYYHVSGQHCTANNVDDVCNNKSCGVRIWSLCIKTFTTGVHEVGRDDIKVFNRKRVEEKEQIFLSLVLFQSTGMLRMLLHRAGPTLSYRCVAWMTKVNDYFTEDPEVDECILERHRYIWSTELPKEIPQDSEKSGRIHVMEKRRDREGKGELSRECSVGNIENGRCQTQAEFENEGTTTDLNNGGTEDISMIPMDKSQRKRQRVLFSQTVNPLYDLERALKESRETAATSTIQGNMVHEGIRLWARQGINCRAHTSFIPPDGDCLWSCFARYILKFFYRCYFIRLYTYYYIEINLFIFYIFANNC